MSLNDKQKRITKAAIQAMAQPRLNESAQVAYEAQNLPVNAHVGDTCRLPDGTEFTFSLEGWREKRAAEKVASELAGNAIIFPGHTPTPVTDPKNDTAPKPEDQLPPPAKA